MSGTSAPAISVVVPTHDRAAALDRLLAGLRGQSLPGARFEVIIVDDGSPDPVQVSDGGVPVRVLRHERPRGPAAARNTGWRAARGPLVAFIDDDCVPEPHWLAALLDAFAGGAAVVQGRVAPVPERAGDVEPLEHTIIVGGLTPLFISASIAYRRDVLERLEGFDETFTRACGEDVELGARITAAGFPVVFSADALVWHEVRRLTLGEHLRHTRKWSDGVRALAMHPELRALLVGRVFWKPTHPPLLAALIALAARRPRLAALALTPWLAHYHRAYAGRIDALAGALATHLVIDLYEIAVVGAGSLRYRTLML